MPVLSFAQRYVEAVRNGLCIGFGKSLSLVGSCKISPTVISLNLLHIQTPMFLYFLLSGVFLNMNL